MPEIGNVGCNAEDEESDGIMAKGLVIRDLPLLMSSWRGEVSLSDYLIKHNIVAIADIDTRKLTRILRNKGAQNGAIVTSTSDQIELDEAAAIVSAREFSGIKGMDLAQVVTTNASYQWTESSWTLNSGSTKKDIELVHHVVAYDYGVKKNILRMLVDRGCKVTVVPAKTPASEVLAMQPDGVFLSNGPGDPEPCDYAIIAISELLASNKPIFGICLGHQLLALASGARTVKMKFGHHGGNHPVSDLSSKKVMITSQNHGFAVDENTLPTNLRATHQSLFDGSLQGVHRIDKPAFSFQGHPEASPGPHDVAPLFDHFIELIKQYK
jgi:carbamoyl-phosphate synthase small subunit